MKQHKITFLLALLTIIGAFFRFYDLNWGSPFYFHPDERNIASSVSQLNFPDQMNPHFFAYGSFPIYIIYFLGLAWNLFSSPTTFDSLPANATHQALQAGQFSTLNFFVPFELAIMVSRIISTFLSTLLIPLLYLIGKTLKDKAAGLLTAIFGTFSVGLIQFGHFGTFEIWTTFLSVLLFYVCLKLLEKYSIKKIIIAGIVCGLLIATKVSNFPLFSVPVLTILLNLKLERIPRFLFLFVAFFITFFITSPFVFFDFSSFLSSINYESKVALGNLPVFYTEEFFNTIPVIFQFLKIYPFLLNPLLTTLFIPSLVYLTYIAIKQRSSFYYLLFTMYYLLFLSNAFLFAKWTRYIIPTLPFVYLIISIFLVDAWCHAELDSASRKTQKIKSYFIKFIIFITIIFAASYFITAFVKPDTRIEAALWAKNNLASNVNILSEVYDLGIVPFNQYFSNIKLFNFYDLDSDTTTLETLNQTLINTDYIILPSQRIIKTRLINPKQFPLGHVFYKSLFEEKSRFKKIYETPCDAYCKITYLNNPVFSFEQTVNVFDRPTVFIFKKIKIENPNF